MPPVNNDSMDTLIISHASALLYHNAPRRPPSARLLPEGTCPLVTTPPNMALVSRARRVLASCGVPTELLASIDFLIMQPSQKRRAMGARCHLWLESIPARSLIELEPGIYVAGVELCAFQMAAELPERTLIELYFELCSRYCMPFFDEEDYRDLPSPRTTKRKLKRFFSLLPSGVDGRRKALRALPYVREGSRSPLETAMVMTLACPKRLGGMGLRDIRMNYRLPLPPHIRQLTRRSSLVCDAYIDRGSQDVEYQGFMHDEPEQKAIDNERRQAMQAMGLTVVELNKQQFFDKDAYRRVLAAIRLNAGTPAPNDTEAYAAEQERLRRFVLRRWLHAADEGDESTDEKDDARV